MVPSASDAFALAPRAVVDDVDPADCSASKPGREVTPEIAAINAEHSRKMSTVLGDIISVLAQSSAHSSLRLQDIKSVVLPALAAGQYKIAIGKDDATGFSRPIATVLWARVTDAIDQELVARIADPLKLPRDGWSGGANIWIVEAVGQRVAVDALIEGLRLTTWGQAIVKYRAAAPGRQVTLGRLRPREQQSNTG